jgi:LysR family transcriptional regulator, regulator for bpeEF and oprC
MSVDQLSAMRAFIRVVESGTFTRAAELLDTPKPTITKLIQGLESHLRTKLLNRTTRRVMVTPDGAAYYERAVRLLSDLDELDSSVSRSQASFMGRLRVDVGSSVATMVLIPALPSFHARYPEIQLDLGVSDRPIDLIADNVDCVLRAGEITDQSLVARRIGEFNFISCAAPGYLKQHGEPQHPSDLEETHLVVAYFSARSGRTFPFTFRRGEETIEVRGRYTLAVNDANAYLSAALAGLGVAHAPRFMLQPHIDRRELRRVLPQWKVDALPFYVVYPPNRHLSNKVRAFVDWIAALIANNEHMRRGPPAT